MSEYENFQETEFSPRQDVSQMFDDFKTSEATTNVPTQESAEQRQDVPTQESAEAAQQVNQNVKSVQADTQQDKPESASALPPLSLTPEQLKELVSNLKGDTGNQQVQNQKPVQQEPVDYGTESYNKIVNPPVLDSERLRQMGIPEDLAPSWNQYQKDLFESNHRLLKLAMDNVEHGMQQKFEQWAEAQFKPVYQTYQNQRVQEFANSFYSDNEDLKSVPALVVKVNDSLLKDQKKKDLFNKNPEEYKKVLAEQSRQLLQMVKGQEGQNTPVKTNNRSYSNRPAHVMMPSNSAGTAPNSGGNKESSKYNDVLKMFKDKM